MSNRQSYESLALILGVVVSLVSFLLLSSEKLNQDFLFTGAKAFLFLPAFAAAVTGIFSVYTLRKKQTIRKSRRVFIIYSYADLDVALKLRSQLEEAGFQIWVDHQEIVPGQRIDDAMIKGLSQSAVALLLVSKNFESSPYVAKQLEFALAAMRSKNELYSPVIPVLLDEQRPPKELAGVMGVKLNDPDGFDRLVRGLNTALEI